MRFNGALPQVMILLRSAGALKICCFLTCGRSSEFFCLSPTTMLRNGTLTAGCKLKFGWELPLGSSIAMLLKRSPRRLC